MEKEIKASLPTLTGSDKQIAWAEKIRAAAVEAIDEITVPEAYAAKLAQCIEWVKGQTAAAWWIDNRTKSILGKPWIALANTELKLF